MTNLSERVMSLSGPDREVDAEIWRIIHPTIQYRLAPSYTASIDAAMTLVPEGDPAFSATFWRLGNDGEGADPAEFKAEILLCSMLTSKRLSATASTPALALCAAALLARETNDA